MSRFIRPYVKLSHLNHRFGQRCGWAPNCINASVSLASIVTYLRSDGVSSYLRPDGTSRYERPE